MLNVCLTFVLIVLGGTVRNWDAGLACPDWPLCFGQIIPKFNVEIFLEWFHRLIASIVGFITLGICIGSLAMRQYRSLNGVISTLALVLVLFQAFLGGMTVMGLLDPKWVSAHLAIGLIFLVTLIWLYVRIRRQEAGLVVSKVSMLVIMLGLTTLLVYCQAVLGAWVASSHAGLACPDFPKCLGEWIPPLVGQVKIHFFHRVLALMVVTAIGGLWWITRSRALLFAFMVTLLQICLGIGNVVFQLPPLVSIAHLMMATLLFAMMFVITYKVKHAQLS